MIDCSLGFGITWAERDLSEATEKTKKRLDDTSMINYLM
jgi:hypothetical protein